MPTYRNDTKHNQYYSNKLKFVPPGETVESKKIIINDNLTKISDEPYHILALDYTDVSFGGVETQTVENLLNARVIRISTDINILIRANSASNSYPYPLNAGDTMDFSNEGYIESLAITSEGAGTTRVINLEV